MAVDVKSGSSRMRRRTPCEPPIILRSIYPETEMMQWWVIFWTKWKGQCSSRFFSFEVLLVFPGCKVDVTPLQELSVCFGRGGLAGCYFDFFMSMRSRGEAVDLPDHAPPLRPTLRGGPAEAIPSPWVLLAAFVFFGCECRALLWRRSLGRSVRGRPSGENLVLPLAIESPF